MHSYLGCGVGIYSYVRAYLRVRVRTITSSSIYSRTYEYLCVLVLESMYEYIAQYMWSTTMKWIVFTVRCCTCTTFESLLVSLFTLHPWRRIYYLYTYVCTCRHYIYNIYMSHVGQVYLSKLCQRRGAARRGRKVARK